MRSVVPASRALTALTCAIVTACATVEPDTLPTLEVPALRGHAQADAPAAGDELLALDDQMRAFAQTNLARISGPMARMNALSELLLASEHLELVYSGETTRTARELFHQRTGNCLSASALYVALAREAGLQAVFQDVPVVPSWHIAGDTFVVERHVNALVLLDGRRFVFDFRPPAAPMYSGARKISDANALAQYYGNLGVERFTAGDLAGAYDLYHRGLQADPTAESVWVNVGVVFARNRQPEDAERVYRHVLELDADNLSALNNLALLEESRGHRLAARRLQKRVERYRVTNPYYLYWRGERKLAARDPAGALADFGEAVRRQPGEADFHFALARTYVALGGRQRAEQSYASALALSNAESAAARYRATMECLLTPERTGSECPGTR